MCPRLLGSRKEGKKKKTFCLQFCGVSGSDPVSMMALPLEINLEYVATTLRQNYVSFSRWKHRCRTNKKQWPKERGCLVCDGFFITRSNFPFDAPTF